MIIKYKGSSEIHGSLLVMDGITDVSYNEVVKLELENGSIRSGRIIRIDGERVVIQVFEGTGDISLVNTKTVLTGKPLEFPVSREILGRVFNGAGQPIDNMGPVFPEKSLDINGMPINPISRVYPKNFINTGISAIDVLTTLIRGQKLPIFSGAGMKHNELAVQIARQAQILNEPESEFVVVFVAMGVKRDVANYFIKSFTDAGTIGKTLMFLNLASEPIMERILAPRCALTAAEYLAYELGYHVLVIMTDMTSYAEALREFSASRNEIPGRNGFPGYMYSDFASLYERAGIINGKNGSVTQLPILTMPNDDITHPIPDLTGYITEGQIVLDRNSDSHGVYPPISVLPSLSRLMKDGIGKGFTRHDHPDLANQLFGLYAKVIEIRSLASVVGEEDLSASDKVYLKFGERFEKEFLSQGPNENRTIEESLNIGWRVLSTLPKSEITRIDEKILDEFYGKFD